MLLIDPTGHITRYFNKTYSWGVEQSDVILVLIFISFFLIGNRKFKEFFRNKYASTIFRILLIFFIYKVIVFGYLVPPVSSISEYLRYFIIRDRTTLISFFIVIPAYLVALKDLKTFFNLMVLMGTFTVVFFLFSVMTGIEIVPFDTLQRYQTGNVLRQFMYSYSAPLILVSLSISVYISGIKIKYKKLLYIGGVFSIIAILISLTKGLFISLVTVILFSIYFTTRSLKISISKGILNALILSIVAIIVLKFFLPSYFGYSKKLFNEIYTLGKTGNYGENKSEGRLDVVLPAQLFMIKQRPLLGVGTGGYKTNNYSNKFDITAYDATDVPITGTLMKYGTIGMLIYYFFYYKFYQVTRKLYLLIKRKKRLTMIEVFKYEFIISITIISYTLSGFISIFGITGELVTGSFIFYIYLGMILACLQRIRKFEYIQTGQAIITNELEKKIDQEL